MIMAPTSLRNLFLIIASALLCTFISIHFLHPDDVLSDGYKADTENKDHNMDPSNQIIKILNTEILKLRKSYESYVPNKPYLVINTSDNKFTLMNANKVLHKGRCSTGSYILLKASGEREWLFKTPRGKFKVNVKLKNPVWYKPDWAYLEEGVPIPSPYSPKRYQAGVLGDFALGFGKGYLVHGTIYKRLLGYPVTHGCVRLDDTDMQMVFTILTHGSKIFIY
jgi:L,D-transpeptidase YbiS